MISRRPLRSGRRWALPGSIAAIALAPAAHGAAPPPQVHERSPSGNILCNVSRGSAECTAVHTAWPSYVPNPGCEEDWSPNVLLLNRAGVSVGACHGGVGFGCGPALWPCTTLAYGRSVRRGAIRCTSRRPGVTCLDRRGVGFTISRERLAIFRGSVAGAHAG